MVEQHRPGGHALVVGHGQLDLGEQLAGPALRHQEGAALLGRRRLEGAGVDQAHARGQRVDAERRPGQVQERECGDGVTPPGRRRAAGRPCAPPPAGIRARRRRRRAPPRRRGDQFLHDRGIDLLERVRRLVEMVEGGHAPTPCRGRMPRRAQEGPPRGAPSSAATLFPRRSAPAGPRPTTVMWGRCAARSAAGRAGRSRPEDEAGAVPAALAVAFSTSLAPGASGVSTVAWPGTHTPYCGLTLTGRVRRRRPPSASPPPRPGRRSPPRPWPAVGRRRPRGDLQQEVVPVVVEGRRRRRRSPGCRGAPIAGSSDSRSASTSQPAAAPRCWFPTPRSRTASRRRPGQPRPGGGLAGEHGRREARRVELRAVRRRSSAAGRPSLEPTPARSSCSAVAVATNCTCSSTKDAGSESRTCFPVNGWPVRLQP